MTVHDDSVRETPGPPSGLWRVRALSPIEVEFGIVTCSRCLRVQRGSNWFDADEIIRALRSFELLEAPTLKPGLCDRCSSASNAKTPPAEEGSAAQG